MQHRIWLLAVAVFDYRIDAQTKWTPFRRRHFKCIFLNKNVWIPIKKITEVCSKGSNYQHPSTGSDNGLALSRRQAIIWTNDCQFTDAYMRHSFSMSCMLFTRSKYKWILLRFPFQAWLHGCSAAHVLNMKLTQRYIRKYLKVNVVHFHYHTRI